MSRPFLESFVERHLITARATQMHNKFKYNPEEHGPVVHTPSPQIKRRHSTAVLLFGWGGAKLNQLARYAPVYTDRGHTVIAATAPFESYLVGVPPELRTRCFDAIHSAASGCRLHAHVFSNTGFVLANALYSDEPDLERRMTSFIVDSAPTYMLPKPVMPWAFTAVMRLGDNEVRKSAPYLAHVYDVMMHTFDATHVGLMKTNPSRYGHLVRKFMELHTL
eukprot:PhM_4_TR3417/c0_g1_i5/m.82479